MFCMPTSCKLVAEIGINHNGCLETVCKMMDMAKAAGFGYVKFQKRNVEKTTPTNRWNDLKDTPWGQVKYIDYKRELELSDLDYECICEEAENRGLTWFASPWDVDSVEFLSKVCLNVSQVWARTPRFIKVASACVTDLDLLDAIRSTSVPVIISTGMSDKKQFDVAIDILGDQIEYVLACTSTYPTAPTEINLRFVRTLKREYPKYRIGFSNHSPGVIFAAASVLYGAEMIETHVTLYRSLFGSDQAASIEFEGMCKLNKYVFSLEQGLGDGAWHVWKSEEAVIKNLRR